MQESHPTMQGVTHVSPRRPASWGTDSSGSDAGRAVTSNPNRSGDPTLHLPQAISGGSGSSTTAAIPSGGNGSLAGNPTQAPTYPVESDLIICKVPGLGSIDSGSVVYRRSPEEKNGSSNPTSGPTQATAPVSDGFSGNLTSSPDQAAAPIHQSSEPSSNGDLSAQTDYSIPYAVRQHEQNVPSSKPSHGRRDWFKPKVEPGQRPTDIPSDAKTTAIPVTVNNLPPHQ